jgi:hypothetical protein
MTPETNASERAHAERAMSWYGWGSPVGLAIVLVGGGVTALLVRVAIIGWP